MEKRMPDPMLELKQMRIWMLWRWEVKENGERTKVPIAAGGGPSGTTEKWNRTWVTYDEVVKAEEKNPAAAGIGFKIPEGYYFIDIDHRALTDPLVQTILLRHDSYAEYSVSGTGIHQYGKCDFTQIPTYIDKNGKLKLDGQFYTKNPNNEMELYIGGITNRFAAYTGNVIENKPLRECTAAILTTLDKDMRRARKVKYSVKRDGEKVTFDLICNLRKQKNGEKFCKLFDKGDFSDYGSQSEADAALCALLAFRAGPDPEMIDAVFRQSALYRDKWDREDYRDATIALGIEACHGVFHKSKMDHPYFILFDDDGKPFVSAPLLAKYIRENQRYILVRDNGKQGTLIYVYKNGCYRLYAPDMMKGVIKGYIAAYDETLVRMTLVSEVYGQLTTDLNYVSQDELNADESLINFTNGLLRVTATELTLLPHSPDVLSTIQIPCRWTGHPEPTPTFDQYIVDFTSVDKAIEQLLLEFMGVGLSNVKGWRMKKSLFMVGDGDTGKSQLKSLTELLLGKGNFIGIDLKEIEARFGTGAIYGTRLAGSSDMSFLSVDELKTFKKITGGDSLFAEFKGQQGFEYTYNGLLWFCMNRLPKFGGDDGQWVYDRIMVVECKNVIPKDKQDKTLLDKMYAEREGIVYKAVKALQTVISNSYRFSEPDFVSKARDTYMCENNTVISFYHECMAERPQPGTVKDTCTTGKVYDVYKAWCHDNNNGYAKTAKEFRDTLAGMLGSTFKGMTIHTDKGTCYRDLTLTIDAKQQYQREYGYDELLG